MSNAPWHATARYKQGRATLQRLAALHPDAVCARCGLTIHEHRGPNLRWHAGHTIGKSMTWQLWLDPYSQPPPGDWLALEVNRCNLAASAQATNAQRNGYDVGL